MTGVLRSDRPTLPGLRGNVDTRLIPILMLSVPPAAWQSMGWSNASAAGSPLPTPGSKERHVPNKKKKLLLCRPPSLQNELVILSNSDLWYEFEHAQVPTCARTIFLPTLSNIEYQITCCVFMRFHNLQFHLAEGKAEFHIAACKAAHPERRHIGVFVHAAFFSISGGTAM